MIFVHTTAWIRVAALVLAGMFAGTTQPEAQEPEGRAPKRPKREVVHPKVGEVLKDFSLKSVDGKTVKLSDFRKKKIFVLELGACT